MKTAKHKIKDSYANLCLSLGQPPNKSPSSLSPTLMLFKSQLTPQFSRQCTLTTKSLTTPPSRGGFTYKGCQNNEYAGANTESSANQAA